MTVLAFAWHDHNRLAQHDQVVAYDDGDTGREEGQETVFEFSYSATSATGPWDPPTTQRIIAPRATSYDAAVDGWYKITVYSARGQAVSWQAHVGVVRITGGVLAIPETRVTTTGDRRVTTSGDVRKTTG